MAFKNWLVAKQYIKLLTHAAHKFFLLLTEQVVK